MSGNTRRILVTVMTVISLVLAGCGGNYDGEADNGNVRSGEQTKDVHMIAYDWSEEGDLFARLYDDILLDFNGRKDLNTTLEVQRIPGEPYKTKLNAVIAANNAPDVFVTHASGIMKIYKEANRIQSLGEAFAADPAWKQRFYPNVLDLLTFDGEVYGVPVSITHTALFYNKGIFEKYGLKVPETYEELKAVSKVLASHGITPIAMGAKEPWVAALISQFAANRIGGNEPFDRIMKGNGTWEDPSFIQSGYVMQELAAMGAFPKDYLGLNYSGMTAMFNNGEAAMIVMGSWFIGQLLNSDSIYRDKIGVAKFPRFTNGKGNENAWLSHPDYNLVISSSAKDPESALAFLKLWSEPQYQARVAEETGKFPVAKTDVNLEKVPRLYKELNELVNDKSDMFMYYDVGLGPPLGDAYNTAIQAILAGKKPEEAFGDLQLLYERHN